MHSIDKVTTRRYSLDKSSGVWIYDLLASGVVPDALIRAGIRSLLRQKISELTCSPTELVSRKLAFIDELRTMPIAIETDAANRQHYEVPTSFFEAVLGPNMKYSCALFADDGCLEHAEENMLALTCARAQLEDGQNILELGCGWGSLSLHMARKYPNARVTGVSNSSSQRTFILAKAQAEGLSNLEIITADIREFDTHKRFDRVVSVEMFEHLKNYDIIMERVSRWLNEQGKLFIHIFTHKNHPYHFVGDENDWLTRYFFSGGTMPSDDLLLYFQKNLCIEHHWVVSGVHYQKTSEAWLKNMSANKAKILSILADTYGKEQTTRWWMYWRMFFLACAELWGYDNGSQWFVSHYLFKK